MDDYYWKLETEGPLVAEHYRNWPRVQNFLVQLADVFTINDQHTRVSSSNTLFRRNTLFILKICSHQAITKSKFFTVRKRSCGKVMFLHLSVSHSFDRRRSLYDVTSCLAHVPSEGASLFLAHVPSRGSLSRVASPLYGKERAVRILLECILFFGVFRFRFY